jgi:hypothetical protein
MSLPDWHEEHWYEHYCATSVQGARGAIEPRCAQINPGLWRGCRKHTRRNFEMSISKSTSQNCNPPSAARRDFRFSLMGGGLVLEFAMSHKFWDAHLKVCISKLLSFVKDRRSKRIKFPRVWHFEICTNGRGACFRNCKLNKGGSCLKWGGGGDGAYCSWCVFRNGNYFLNVVRV